MVELDRSNPQQPIGLYYISAFLEHNQVPVEVFDLHYKKDIARFETGLRANPPVLVGVSCLDENVARAVSVILHTKKVSPLSKTLLGGPGTYFQKYKDFLQTYPEIDYLAKGEGECTTLELYQALTNRTNPIHVPNLVYLDDDAFLSTPLRQIEDLDSLPFPRRPARYSKDRFDLISGPDARKPAPSATIPSCTRRPTVAGLGRTSSTR